MLPFSILMPPLAPKTYRLRLETTCGAADHSDDICLCCGRTFQSRGAEHRVCDTCKRVKEKS